MSFGRVAAPVVTRPDTYRIPTSEQRMKVQEDPTEALDLPATHFRCIEEDVTFSLTDYGYGSDDNPVTSTDDIYCPNADEDEDHGIELQHITDKPVASPDAKKRDNVLAGNPWENLSEFDDDHWHFGDNRFSYDLEDA